MRTSGMLCTALRHRDSFGIAGNGKENGALAYLVSLEGRWGREREVRTLVNLFVVLLSAANGVSGSGASIVYCLIWIFPGRLSW